MSSQNVLLRIEIILSKSDKGRTPSEDVFKRIHIVYLLDKEGYMLLLLEERINEIRRNKKDV